MLRAVSSDIFNHLLFCSSVCSDQHLQRPRWRNSWWSVLLHHTDHSTTKVVRTVYYTYECGGRRRPRGVLKRSTGQLLAARKLNQSSVTTFNNVRRVFSFNIITTDSLFNCLIYSRFLYDVGQYSAAELMDLECRRQNSFAHMTLILIRWARYELDLDRPIWRYICIYVTGQDIPNVE